MILITGGTGFIGSVLIRQLVRAGHPIRLLLHPSRTSPRLLKGVSIEVAIASFSDEKGIRAALKDVDVVYHLAGAERKGYRADLMKVDVEGTRTITRVIGSTSVKRIFYLSHLGADRASAFPLLKAKGIAENDIINASVDYTIIRSGIVFGLGDAFTTRLARLIKQSPGIVLLPGNGNMLLQPIWVEDLVTCMVWALSLPGTINKTIQIGGPEYLTFKEILSLIMEKTGQKRAFQQINPVYLRFLTEFLETFSHRFPSSVFLLDYLASDRVCALDSLPNTFNLLPSRFSNKIDYLIPQRKLSKGI